MTHDLLYIVPAGLFWISALVWLLRGVGRLRPAAAWVTAWISIWGAGVILASNPGPGGSAASSLLGTLFAGLLLVGTYRFGDREVPRALPPVVAVLALGVGLAGWWAPGSVALLSSAIDATLVGWAAALLIRNHTLNRKLGPAERTIGPLFLAVMVLEVLDSRHHGSAAPPGTLGAWVVVGATTGFLMVIVIGERAALRAAEQAAALEAESGLLHGMSEAVPVGILLSDPEGNIQLINDSMREHIAVKGRADAWVGRRALDLMQEALGNLMETERQMVVDRSPEIARDRRMSFSGQPLRFKDGRTILLSAHSVHGADGRHLGRVWVSRDATEERRLSERIQHAERMETVGTLAGGLAHDFNNQLTAILGNAALIRESQSLAEDSRQTLADLEEAARHCAELTRGLLAFARRQPAEPRNIELADVIDRVDTLLRPLLPPDVVFRTRIADDVRQVYADEVQLQRLLANLLVNARDAVGVRGSIELVAEACEGGVEIAVHDDGHGMDDSTRRRIFDPFFTTKPVGAGTGLGLAVAYGIVEAHGGRIEVESAPGKGSTFRVIWPGPDADMDPAVPAIPSAARPAAGARVLLAEDEPAVRRLVTRALERAGLEVTAVADGDAAIIAFEKQPGAFDIVLFDYSMPGRNGLAAIRRVRELRADFPAIVMSGHASAFGDDWPSDIPLLMKPFAPERLVQRLAEVMGTRPGDQGRSEARE